MLRFTTAYVGISCLMCLVLSGCASQSGENSGPSTENSSGETNSPRILPSNVKDPSPIDNQSPPTVKVSGVGEGDLILGSSIPLNVDISQYPLQKNWQEGVVSLNGVEVKRLDSASTKFDVKGLREGLNQIVVYLVRSWGESLKVPTASVSISFFYKKKDAAISSSLKSNSPGLLLISPGGAQSSSFTGENAKKLMFDFLITQSQGRKYRIYYTLNGDTREVAADGAPYFFYNLPRGNHTLKVELVDSKGKPVRVPFAQAESTFRID